MEFKAKSLREEIIDDVVDSDSHLSFLIEGVRQRLGGNKTIDLNEMVESLYYIASLEREPRLPHRYDDEDEFIALQRACYWRPR